MTGAEGRTRVSRGPGGVRRWFLGNSGRFE
jgi:hypothetical protein